ncbi:MAG: outer membrane lipoprotein chaperone LolA [Wenzhouxiangella sp.]
MVRYLINRLPIALLTVVLSGSALADPRAQLDRFAEGLESLAGGFTQITLEQSGRILEQTEGRLYYQGPDRFRWSYLEPFPQELVADGERLWHYDESLDQVTVRDQPPASESPLLVLTRPDLLDRFYQIEATDEVDILRFRPVQDEAEFEHATLYFDEGLPVALELNDRFGQLTRLELFDLTRNPDLDPDLFTFVVPPEADLLEGY